MKLAAASPLHTHQNAGDQHKQCRCDEHHSVNGQSVLGLIAGAHDSANLKVKSQ